MDDCGHCRRCLRDTRMKVGDIDLPILGTRMVVCPTCGNKRCPKATNHELACTNSNAPGQPGSDY